MKNHTKFSPTKGNQKKPPLFIAFLLCVVSVLTLAAAIKPISLPTLAVCVAEHGLDACAKKVRRVQS
jgi:hypothetical protein